MELNDLEEQVSFYVIIKHTERNQGLGFCTEFVKLYYVFAMGETQILKFICFWLLLCILSIGNGILKIGKGHKTDLGEAKAKYDSGVL